MLEWVPAGLNTGALSGAKASSSRTRDTYRTNIRVITELIDLKKKDQGDKLV
jgi:hypothetical protein